MNYQFVEDLVVDPTPKPHHPKVVVYTCNYNQMDYWGNIAAHPFVRTVVFSDEGESSNGVEVIHDTRNYKWLKKHSCLIFPDADFTIYHDCNLKLKLHPFDIVKNIQNEQLALWKNSDCAYRNDQRRDYLRSFKLPVGTPNYDDRFIVRKNCRAVAKMEKLWEETDNLSLSVWKADIHPMVLIEAEKVYITHQHRRIIVPIIWSSTLQSQHDI